MLRFNTFYSKKKHFLALGSIVLRVRVHLVPLVYASNPKLYDFYSASQFVQFGHRERDIDEIAENPILVQMLKYFRD